MKSFTLSFLCAIACVSAINMEIKPDCEKFKDDEDGCNKAGGVNAGLCVWTGINPSGLTPKTGTCENQKPVVSCFNHSDNQEACERRAGCSWVQGQGVNGVCQVELDPIGQRSPLKKKAATK